MSEEKKKLSVQDGSSMKLNRSETAKLTVWLMEMHTKGEMEKLSITELYDAAEKFMGRQFSNHVMADICKGMNWQWKKKQSGRKPGTGKYSRLSAIMTRMDAIEEVITKPAKTDEIFKEELTTLKTSLNKLREEMNKMFGLMDARLLVMEKKAGITSVR